MKTLTANHTLPMLRHLLTFAERNPARVEHAIEALWQSDPALLRDITVDAVQTGQIGVEVAASWLQLSPDEFQEVFDRASSETGGYSTIARDADKKHTARLAKSGVTVWEIVREYRREQSLSRLQEHFSSISHLELFEALLYAEENSEEINAEIAKYEDFVKLKNAEYPKLGQD